jgi:hypothetical protein
VFRERGARGFDGLNADERLAAAPPEFAQASATLLAEAVGNAAVVALNSGNSASRMMLRFSSR